MNDTLLHFPIAVDDPCPRQEIQMSEDVWKKLELAGINDEDGLKWNIQHRLENINTNAVRDVCTLKIACDSKAEQIYSAGMMRPAGLKNGGIYKLDVKAADGGGTALTGITFLDGEENDLYIYNHQRIDVEDESCVCCFDNPVEASCQCNCEDYLNSQDLNDTAQTLGDDTSDTESVSYNEGSSPNGLKSACGLQIYAGQSPYIVTWCTFNDTREPMSASSELAFDPSTEFHSFTIEFFYRKEEIALTSCLRIFVDDQQMSELTGIPELNISTNLIFHLWNKNNILPPLDVFNLWEGRAKFRQLTLPPSLEEMCRYGDPFQGGTNPIVRYEVAIGTFKDTPDVADFQEVFEPCIPCVNDCLNDDCEPTCSAETYSTITFTMTNININQTYNGSFYIIVKAVTASGAEAISASNGFYIDLTHPVFETDIFLYFDVLQGEFLSTNFQGSNDTIKVIWLCTDDKSEIKEYPWAIGTSIGGEEIQNFTSTGTFSSAQNSNLTGLLMNNSTYFVSVKCTNAAGLSTLWQDEIGVTVLLEEPDVASVEAVTVGAEQFDGNVYPSTALQATDNAECGLTWEESTDPNVERYDLCIGSSFENVDDIVPCMLVGYNSSGKAEIKQDYLYIDDTPYYKVSELRALSAGIYDSSQFSNDSENVFKMERERTQFLNMRLCNKANICSYKFVNSILFTGEKAELLTSSAGEAVKLNFVPSGAGRRKRDITVSEIQIETPEGMSPGQSVSVMELSDEDLYSHYGSSASSTFEPYTVDPSSTVNMTERILYGQIQSFLLLVALSPVGQEQLPGIMTMTFSQSRSGSVNESYITDIVHWNPDIQQWQLTSRSCIQENDTTIKNSDDSTTIKICDTRRVDFNESLDEKYFWKETQFAVVLLLTTRENTAPEFVEPLHVILDDNIVDAEILLKAVDIEHPNQILHIALCSNCYGITTVQLIVSDIPESTEIVSAQLIVNITVEVLHVNIPPKIALYSSQRAYLLDEDPTEQVMINKDQDGEKILFDIVTIIAYDIDEPHNVTLYWNTSGIGEFVVQDVTRETLYESTGCVDFTCFNWNDTIPALDTEWKAFVISYQLLNTTYTGICELKMIAQDDNGTYSDVVTIASVIMENNCAHGTCRSMNPLDYTCDDILRIANFDLRYTCDCPISWQGLYCEDDVDECSLGLCDGSKLCENTIGSFNCFCQSSDIFCHMSLEIWQFVLIVVAFVILIILIVLVCKRKFQTRGRVYPFENYHPGDHEESEVEDNEANEAYNPVLQPTPANVSFAQSRREEPEERDHPPPADIGERMTGPEQHRFNQADLQRDDLPSAKPMASYLGLRENSVVTVSAITFDGLTEREDEF